VNKDKGRGHAPSYFYVHRTIPALKIALHGKEKNQGNRGLAGRVGEPPGLLKGGAQGGRGEGFVQDRGNAMLPIKFCLCRGTKAFDDV